MLMESFPIFETAIHVLAGMKIVAPACTSRAAASQMHASSSRLQKKDFVRTRVPVGWYYSSRCDLCRKKNQM